MLYLNLFFLSLVYLCVIINSFTCSNKCKNADKSVLKLLGLVEQITCIYCFSIKYNFSLYFPSDYFFLDTCPNRQKKLKVEVSLKRLSELTTILLLV